MASKRHLWKCERCGHLNWDNHRWCEGAAPIGERGMFLLHASTTWTASSSANYGGQIVGYECASAGGPIGAELQ